MGKNKEGMNLIILINFSQINILSATIFVMTLTVFATTQLYACVIFSINFIGNIFPNEGILLFYG